MAISVGGNTVIDNSRAGIFNQVISNANSRAFIARGIDSTNAGGLYFQTPDETEVGFVNVGTGGNMNITVDGAGLLPDARLELNIGGFENFRFYDDTFRVGTFSTNPYDATSIAGEGVWIREDGLVSLGREGVPLEINRINSADGLLINFRYDGSNGGNITTSGGTLGFTQVSDERLKSNIVDVPAEAAKTAIKALQVKEFTYDRDPSQARVKGFVAQEVQAVIPEAVSKVSNDPEDTTLGINYLAMFPYVVSALADATAKIEELEVRIAALEAA